MTAEDWLLDWAIEGESEEYKTKKMQKNKKNKQKNQPLNCSKLFDYPFWFCKFVSGNVTGELQELQNLCF